MKILKAGLYSLLILALSSQQPLAQTEAIPAGTQPSSEIYGASLARAQGEKTEEDKWTKHFHPRFIFTAEYDDNVFLEPNNEDDDFIFVLSPGLFVPIPFDADSHLFSFDYHSDFGFFEEFEDQNFDNHYFLANLDLNFPKFYVKTYDSFRYTSVRADTEFEDRIPRYENLYSFNIGKEDWYKWAVEVNADWYFVQYEDEFFEVLDRDDYTVGGTVFYQIRPKYSLFADYDHTFIRYDDDPSRDGDADRIQGGLKGEILSKLVGTIRAGFEDRRYEDETQDFSSFIAGAALVYNFSNSTTFTLTGERSNKESVYKTNNFYTANFVSLAWNQSLFWQRLDGRLRGTYQNNDYDELTTEGAVTQERDDDLYGFDVGVEYEIREWLTTGVDYYYLKRDSNFANFDYTDNRVLWKVSVLL
jgi:hypothetical protein